jgi:putative flippase GtrA
MLMKKDYKIFLNYLCISVVVTLLDIIVSYLLENYILPNSFDLNVKILIANTTGIIVGFIIQFFLAAKHVYNKSDVATFTKFFLTFLLGLFLQNSIVVLSRTFLFNGSSTGLAFLISKLLSIAIPFVFIFYIRQKWIGQINSKQSEGEL